MVWSAGDRATKAMPLEKSQMTTTIDSMRGGRVSGTLRSDHIGRKNTYFVYMTLGFLANLSVKASDKRHHMKSEVDAEIEPPRAQAAAGQA